MHKQHKDIRLLSDFKRNTNELVEQLSSDGKPISLTINGKVKLVVQDAASYQRVLEELDKAQAIAGVRQGWDDFVNGRTQPLKKAIADIRRQIKSKKSAK